MSDDLDPVPPGSLLVHAGMPKTGTTALQRVSAARRDLLAGHGVRYPGTGSNHRKALFAYSARPVGWDGPGPSTPKVARWRELRDEVRSAEGQRVWLSNENLSDEPEETLRSLVAELDREATVVLTLRSLPAQLASAWQQYLKSGVWISFETWLRRTIGDEPNPTTTPSFARRLAVGDVVDTWVRVLGRDRVVVVVLDPADRSLVPRAFERLLGLPTDVLTADELAGHDANRSLTAAEAELLRRVNRVVRDRGDVGWRDYERFVRDGAVEAMLARGASGDQRIVPPTWAVQRAAALAEQQADRVRAAGVRVVGDLTHLASPVRSVDKVRAPKAVPVDAAAEALLAMLSTGLGRGRDFSGAAPEPRPAAPPVRRPTLEEQPTAAVVRELARRLRRRLQRLRPAGRRQRARGSVNRK
ncbi:hypothetical protein SAMN04488544_3218 [Microlunatus sagamiharensis]|uniref:Sulfotransferase family protein n=1 Tax=Microlunatus sagamiharensis TaxID=546874 RepID=A0A1H2N400_9ACTN|nr:hypothetical protein [Microlunatus sagamiharensis]SDU99815.1 hypothetical protein SAMN04488544_3218 [Microlunatus sagamiharensis]